MTTPHATEVPHATGVAAVPRQAGPVDPPSTLAAEPVPAPSVPAPLIGRDRPLTSEERQFFFGGLALCLFLDTFIIIGLLLAELVWS